MSSFVDIACASSCPSNCLDPNYRRRYRRRERKRQWAKVDQGRKVEGIPPNTDITDQCVDESMKHKSTARVNNTTLAILHSRGKPPPHPAPQGRIPGCSEQSKHAIKVSSSSNNVWTQVNRRVTARPAKHSIYWLASLHSSA